MGRTENFNCRISCVEYLRGCDGCCERHGFRNTPGLRKFGILGICFLATCMLEFHASTFCFAFSPTGTRRNSRGITFDSKSRRHQVLYDDFADFSDDDGNKEMPLEDSAWYAALRARQLEFESRGNDNMAAAAPNRRDPSLNVGDNSRTSSQSTPVWLDNWKTAQCVSTVRLTLNQDWIRRIAIENYPLAVCGTAGGHLVLADLSTGSILDSISHVHASRSADDALLLASELQSDDASFLPPTGAVLPPLHMEEALETLYGPFDGGGIVAVAMKGDWIASSGREGGVNLCQIVGTEEDVYKGSRGKTTRQTKLELKHLGRIPSLEGSYSGSSRRDTVVTSLAFDDMGMLWIGGYDGILRAYDTDTTEQEAMASGSDQIDNEGNKQKVPVMLEQKDSLLEVDVGSPILHLSVHEEVGCGIASTLHKGVVLFSLDDGELLAQWNPFANKIRKEYVRSAFLLKDISQPNSDRGRDQSRWTVICGGSKGSLFQRVLNIDNQMEYIDESAPFLDIDGGIQQVTPLRPNHEGPVVALASPAPGLLVSGALDGSMRVWDCSRHQIKPVQGDFRSDEEDHEDFDPLGREIEAEYDDITDEASSNGQSRPQCLYALSGYKVWLGSIHACPGKLVSDGADNTIIVHSFDGSDDDTGLDVLSDEDEDEDEDQLKGFL